MFKRPLLVAAMFLLPCCAAVNFSGAQERIDDARLDKITELDGWDEYERRLNSILRTRRDEEKNYVSQVVQLVRDGKLPVRLVDLSWTWARNNRPHTEYPFVYFVRILKLQADKVNVPVPKFDFAIYSSSRR